jgi:tRNA G26 N,N-dimethylase Trm1
MIEIFKTNVQKTEEAKRIVGLLQGQYPDSRINFDLNDCDKVLRIDCQRIDVSEVISALAENGFFCEALQ